MWWMFWIPWMWLPTTAPTKLRSRAHLRLVVLNGQRIDGSE